MAVLSLPPLRDYQLPVLLSEATDDLTVSAPQIGKTFTGALFLLTAAWYGGKSPLPWWWMAPTYEQARHGYTMLCNFARSAEILSDATTAPPLKARLVNGALIEARSWDNAEGLYGPTIRGGVVDEFGQLTHPAYGAISSRRAETIARGEGKLRYLGNVGEMGGVAEVLWRRAEAREPGFAARRWTWRDRVAAHECSCGVNGDPHKHNPECHRGRYLAFVDNERSRMSAPQFRQLYEAEWVDWNLLPAYLFDRAVHVTERASYQSNLPIDLSCDFNVDPLCWILGHHKGREAWAFDEIVIGGGATTTEACKEFLERFRDKKVAIEVYGDASGNARTPKSHLTDYDIIRQVLGSRSPFAMHVPAANPPVTARLNAFNAKLHAADGTISYQVHPRCKTLIADLARVSLRAGTHEIDKRNRQLTHASDAEGYRIVTLFPVVEYGPAVVGAVSALRPYYDEIMSERF